MLIRPATPADVSVMVRFIRELAEYEKLLHVCRTSEAGLAASLFPEQTAKGGHAVAEAIIGELDGVPQGMALFFTNFSTFECKPGLYLEDLYVTPAARGKGLGKALLVRLAQIAVERGYARFEWSVLDWNEPAIGFYKKLGAVPMDEWTVFRVAGPALGALASHSK
jgi:GNAT superfamily N-acetyltransferase